MFNENTSNEQAIGQSLYFDQDDNGLPKVQGWMHKLSPNWIKGWQSRYFLLEDKVLSWFKKEEDLKNGRMSGAIDLNLVRIESQYANPKRERLLVAENAPLQGVRPGDYLSRHLNSRSNRSV